MINLNSLSLISLSNCILGQNVLVANGVQVGNYCTIQNNISLYEGVILEDYAFCGPSMVFTNVKTPRCEFPRNTIAVLNQLWNGPSPPTPLPERERGARNVTNHLGLL
jgi:hypothetical protein